MAKLRQEIRDFTFGVDYEWMYEVKQTEPGTVIFEREDAPKLFEEMDVIENAYANGEIDDEAYENWWLQFVNGDVYRLYALRAVQDHKTMNRYDALIPHEANTVQQKGEGLLNWESVVPTDDWCWVFDGEKVYLNAIALGNIVFALLKVRQ